MEERNSAAGPDTPEIPGEAAARHASGEGSRGARGERPRLPLREQEPFATIRAFPRRFAWGIPAAFVVSIGAAAPFADRNLSVAIALQLFLQTLILLWLYVPALRRRVEEERSHSAEAAVEGKRGRGARRPEGGAGEDSPGTG